MTKQKKKAFDAVEFMRTIRDELSETFRTMSYEEQREYIDRVLRARKADQTMPRKPTSPKHVIAPAGTVRKPR